MSEITPIDYLTVSWAIKQINKFLLQAGKGYVFSVQVDAKNTIIDINSVPVNEALAGGFEPVKFLGNKKA